MVLVVDDNLDMCNVLAHFIRAQGCEAEAVNNPLEAIPRMKKRRPSLVILDDHMPQLSGLDLLKAMKADRELHDVPVVMLSADANPGRVNAAEQVGALDWLKKGEINPLIDLVHRYGNAA